MFRPLHRIGANGDLYIYRRFMFELKLKWCYGILFGTGLFALLCATGCYLKRDRH